MALKTVALRMFGVVAAIFLSTFAHADGRSQFDCGLLSGLVVAADSLKEPTPHPVYLYLDGWIAIAELDTAKAKRLDAGLVAAIASANVPTIRDGLKAVELSLAVEINHDYGYGDSSYWGQVVNRQQAQYASVFQGLADLRGSACN